MAQFASYVLSAAFLAYICTSQTLPSLPDRFTAVIEANILQKNQTWLVEEWYDRNASKAKRLFYFSNLIATQYEDFSDGKDQLWSYTTTHDDTSNALQCTLSAYSQNHEPWQNDQSKSGQLVSSQSWFLFGSNFTETYIGKTTVRGIHAEGWTRNVTNSWSFGPTTTSFDFQLTYYFSVAQWNWFMSSTQRIPVRVEIEGTRTTDNGTVSVYNYHHYYDYVQFLPNDLSLEEELVFDIPDFYEQCNTTSYCNTYDTADICTLTKGPALPSLPYGFSATWEYSTADLPYGDISVRDMTSLFKTYYDYDGDRVHVIWYFEDGYYRNALHQLDLFGEETEGQRWMWKGDGVGGTPMTADDEVTQCFMGGITGNYSGYDYFVPVDNGHVVNPNRLFFFDEHDQDPTFSDEIWMGYTTKRGISVEKWKANVNVSILGSSHTTSDWIFYPLGDNQKLTVLGSVYWYFSVANWTFPYMANESVIPVAMELVGVYGIYNWSDATQDYSITEYETELNDAWHVVEFVKGTPDDSFFQPPTYWRRYCTVDENYCTLPHPTATIQACDDEVELPTLPQHKYFAVLEGNDMVAQSTHILKVWYNYDKNELRSEYIADGNIVVTFDQLDDDKRWTWVQQYNDSDNILSCDVKPYTSTITEGNEEFAEEYTSVGHIKRVADLWRFGPEYNVTYLGDVFSVRDIDARAWHSVSNGTYQYNDSSIFVSWESLFYFADTEWNYYKAVETADIPLLVTFKGTYSSAHSSGEFNTEYQVVSFFSGPEAFDEEEMELVFEDWYAQCNVTKYCNTYPSNSLCSDARGPSMPTLPDTFFAVMEGTSVSYDENGEQSYSGTWVIEEWYDYPSNMAHVTFHSGPDWIADAMHQLDRLDENQKWIWFGNAHDDDGDDADGDEMQRCVLTPPIKNFTGVDVFVQETQGHIASPSRWFRWNDGVSTTTDIWHGYTTARGIPAEKWKSTWSEYDEVPGSPLQETYAIQFDATATYYWSNASWDIVASNWDRSPLKLELTGTYTLYNKSATTGNYDILWTTNSFESTFEVVVFNAAEPDEENFAIPTLYSQCNTSVYCAQYASSAVCTGTADTGNSDEQLSSTTKGRLGAGYIVLMFFLFLLGLLIGVVLDRYLVRKQGRASFKADGAATAAGQGTDANL